MEIGDPVLYEGRLHYLRGLDPMSVPERRAQLEDAETSVLLWVPLDEVAEASGEGFRKGA